MGVFAFRAEDQSQNGNPEILAGGDRRPLQWRALEGPRAGALSGVRRDL